MIVAIYVDDFLIFYADETELKALKDFLNDTFKMKDIGLAKCCLGMRINQGNDFIEIDQTNYIHEILDRFNMKDCKPGSTPSCKDQKLSVTKYLIRST